MMDEPWVTFTVSNSNQCDLQMLPDTIRLFDYAFALPKAAPKSLVDMFSEAVLDLQESGEFSKLEREFISQPSSGCPLHSQISETPSVKFFQVRDSLWREGHMGRTI